MIARLRQAHPWAVLVPAVLAAGGLAMLGPAREFETQTALDAGLPTPESDSSSDFLLDLEGGELVRLRTWSSTGAGGALVEVAWPEDVPQPEVLVYAAGTGGVGNALPSDAHFVGSLSGASLRRWEWPAGAGAQLILFSLVHQEIIGSVKLR